MRSLRPFGIVFDLEGEEIGIRWSPKLDLTAPAPPPPSPTPRLSSSPYPSALYPLYPAQSPATSSSPSPLQTLQLDLPPYFRSLKPFLSEELKNRNLKSIFDTLLMAKNALNRTCKFLDRGLVALPPPVFRPPSLPSSFPPSLCRVGFGVSEGEFVAGDFVTLVPVSCQSFRLIFFHKKVLLK